MAVTHVQHVALERTPLVARDPDLSAAGIVDVLREPADGIVVGGGFRGTERVVHVTVESTGLDDAETRTGHPVAFIIADGDLVIRPYTHAVGSAQSIGDRFQFRTVLAHFDDAAV